MDPQQNSQGRLHVFFYAILFYLKSYFFEVIIQYNLTQMHKAKDHGWAYNSFLDHWKGMEEKWKD